MKQLNLIIGGLKLSENVLYKYKNIYQEKSITIPFTFTAMILNDKYTNYNIVNDVCANYDAIHLHVLSGSCYYLHHFLNKYPNNISKIKSQIYDSPCHIKGIVPSLKKLYYIPPYISNTLLHTIFNDCYQVSEYFMKNIPVSGIPTGIITSKNDIIAPSKEIDDLIQNWNKENIKILSTDSKHIESYKDYTSKYIEFCHSIKNQSLH